MGRWMLWFTKEQVERECQLCTSFNICTCLALSTMPMNKWNGKKYLMGKGSKYMSKQ